MLCIAGLGPSAQASAARQVLDEGSVGIQLLDAPLDRRDDPRALRYIVDHLPPGTTIKRHVLVVNKTDARQHIELYPAAATIEEEEFLFAAGRTANELASWISLDQEYVDLESGEEAEVEVTIDVPATGSAGERYAVVWAAVASRPKPSANVNQIHRVGVRVYLDVGEGGEPVSAFTIGELTPARDEDGEPSVAIQVTNTGKRALDMGGSVTFTDGPGGMRAGPFNVVQGTTLAPGQAGTVVVRFPRELPNGPWNIEVNLESGKVKDSASGRITFPDPGEVGRSTVLSALTSSWGLATVSLGLALLALAGLAFAARRSRAAAARE